MNIPPFTTTPAQRKQTDMAVYAAIGEGTGYWVGFSNPATLGRALTCLVIDYRGHLHVADALTKFCGSTNLTDTNREMLMKAAINEHSDMFFLLAPGIQVGPCDKKRITAVLVRMLKNATQVGIQHTSEGVLTLN